MKQLPFMALVNVCMIAPYSQGYAAEKLCVLDYPKPMLKTNNFKLDKEKRMATESVKLNRQVTLTITNGGCEYSTATYSFTFKETPQETPSTSLAYERAIELLTLAETQPTLNDKFKDAKTMLSNYLKLVVEPKMKEQLYIENKPHLKFSETIWVDADMKNLDSKVDVVISSGPY